MTIKHILLFLFVFGIFLMSCGVPSRILDVREFELGNTMKYFQQNANQIKINTAYKTDIPLKNLIEDIYSTRYKRIKTLTATFKIRDKEESSFFRKIKNFISGDLLRGNNFMVDDIDGKYLKFRIYHTAPDKYISRRFLGNVSSYGFGSGTVGTPTVGYDITITEPQYKTLQIIIDNISYSVATSRGYTQNENVTVSTTTTYKNGSTKITPTNYTVAKNVMHDETLTYMAEDRPFRSSSKIMQYYSVEWNTKTFYFLINFFEKFNQDLESIQMQSQ